MMFNESVFKRLCKSAWSGAGITIGNDGGTYILAGGYWIIRIKSEALSKKAMATLIELTGHLPEEGELWVSYKDGEDQYELDCGFETYRTETIFDGARKASVTNVLVDQSTAQARMIQDDNNNIILINECFVDLIDNNHIITEIGEHFADEPFRNEAAVMWKNNMCELVGYKRTLDEHSSQPEIVLALQKVRL